MPMTQSHSSTRFNDLLQRGIDDKMKNMIDKLIYVGETVLGEARSNHIYLNQTGNLCSSIGYTIVNNGKVIITSSFETVKDGIFGSNKGRKFIQDLIAENSSGLVFIMVAGMPYAKYVEAMNLNVLDSAEQMAARMIRDINNGL